jgi:hypothetical protein
MIMSTFPPCAVFAAWCGALVPSDSRGAAKQRGRRKKGRREPFQNRTFSEDGDMIKNQEVMI